MNRKRGGKALTLFEEKFGREDRYTYNYSAVIHPI